jgi:hypothetical protein
MATISGRLVCLLRTVIRHRAASLLGFALAAGVLAPATARAQAPAPPSSHTGLAEALKGYGFSQAAPDRFYEARLSSEALGEVEGWVHYHWLGREASGESAISRFLMYYTGCAEDLRLPPVMREVELEITAEGAAMRRMRTVRPDRPPEVVTYPPGCWLLRLPLEVGHTWTVNSSRMKTWAQIQALDARNPDPLIDAGPCLRVARVAAEPAPSGVTVEVEESWWAEGFGPVMIQQHRGERSDLVWDTLQPMALADVVPRADELADHLTLRLVPEPGAGQEQSALRGGR